MAVRASFENSNEYVQLTPPLGERRRRTLDADDENRVGVFSTLTNAYALVAIGASENFYRYIRLPSSPIPLFPVLATHPRY
jgi:hypothetical protein